MQIKKLEKNIFKRNSLYIKLLGINQMMERMQYPLILLFFTVSLQILHPQLRILSPVYSEMRQRSIQARQTARHSTTVERRIE